MALMACHGVPWVWELGENGQTFDSPSKIYELESQPQGNGDEYSWFLCFFWVRLLAVIAVYFFIDTDAFGYKLRRGSNNKRK